MATENLKVKITADASQAKAEIGKFKNSLKDTVGAAEDATASVTKFKGALAALAAVKVAKAMIKNAISVAAVGDAIKDNAQKVFMGTTAYQEWGYVLQQNGVNMSALKMGMRKFSQEVATGSDTLSKYGITATDVDTAFGQAVATIQSMSSETEKIAAATELFGSRALELMPVLNLTNQETSNLMQSYRLLGGTMSNELIAASDTCSDSITAMKAAWGGLRNVLAAYVIPVVTKVVQWITVAIAKVRILLAAIFGIKETFGGGGKKSLPATTASVAKSTGNTANNLKKATKQAKELRRTMMGIDELSRLAEKATSGASSGSSPSGGSVSVPSVGGDVGSFDGIISDETLAKIQSFQEKIDAIKDKLHGAYLILKGLVEISFGNFKQGFKDISDGLELVFPGIADLKAKWADLKAKLGEKIEAAKVVLEDKFSAAWATIKGVWDTITTTIGNKAQTAKAVLEDKVSSVWATVKGVWESIKKSFTEVIAKVGVNIPTWDTVKAKWEEFKKNLATISSSVGITLPTWNDFKSKWKALTDKFSAGNVKIKITLPKWKELKGKWNNLVGKFKDIKRKISLDISTKLSQLRGWINSYVIGPLNNTIRKVLPSFGGIDYLHAAKGAGLTAPTAVLAGEYPGAKNNPEVIAPQSLMADTMRDVNGDLVSAFAQMTRQVIAAIEDKDLSVKIGDEAIARSAQRGNAAYRNRTGKALLSI